MTCQRCGGQLPGDARFCPGCGAPVPAGHASVDTGGGAYVGGDVRAGGDFVGRDQIVRGDQVRGDRVAADSAELARLFADVYGRIEAPTAAREADAEEIRETVRRVEREAAKGEQADTERLGRWLNTLLDVAPDVAEVAVNALTNPGAAVAGAIRAVAARVSPRPA